MKINLSAEQGMDRYWVHQPGEIQRLLAELQHAHATVTLGTEDGAWTLLTRLLHLEREGGGLWLDRGRDAALNLHLEQSPRLVVAGNLHGVHLQFETMPPVTSEFAGQAAWRLACPTALLRLQRREYYRLGTSLVNPLRCLIPLEAGLVEATVMDISVGGVAILAYGDADPLQAGRVFSGCKLLLPDSPATFVVTMRVVNTFVLALRNGRRPHRAGCQFVALPPNVETEIQRYILKTERDRRSRYL